MPFTEYRFSLSLRHGHFNWTQFTIQEYQFTPKIIIDVKGEIKIGNNITLECNTELNPSVIDSISWRNNIPNSKNILKITPLTVNNMMREYFCEIRYNFRMIQKSYNFNKSNIEGIFSSYILLDRIDITFLGQSESYRRKNL